MPSSLTPPAEPPDDATAELLRRDAPDDEDNLDAQLQLARLRRQLTGAAVEPVRFRQWELDRRLGRGGMGSVYLARDPELDRWVALKVLGVLPASARAEMEQRMRREAKALARIRHPNVVQVHGVDLDHGRTVIEMEYIDGPTLRGWQPGRSWRDIVAAYADAGDGLSAIHAAGLVHRDVKPDNLVMGSDGQVKVVDLGLAVGARPPRAPLAKNTPDAGLLGVRVTQASSVVGTPGYMAPELYGSGDGTAACDQFGLVASLYQALYGVLPFDTDRPEEQAQCMRQGTLQLPEQPVALPRWLTKVLRRGLAFEPDQRHASMAALVGELRDGLKRRRRWWLGGSLLGSMLALATVAGRLGWAVGQPPPDPCDLLEHELAESWSTERQRVEGWARAERAGPEFLASSTFARSVQHRISAWTDERLDLCRAQRGESEGSPGAVEPAMRARCLDHARNRLEAEVTGLAERPGGPTPEALIQASASVERLPYCREPAELQAWGAEHEPELLAQVEDDIAAALSLERQGDYLGAQEQASAAAAASEGSLPRAHAEALYRWGHALGSQDRSAEAFAVLDRARNAAYVAGYDALLCDAVVYQAKLAALVSLQGRAGARDLGLATACMERVGGRSPVLQADMLEARGLLAVVAGEPARAVPWHEEALRLRREHFGSEHFEVSRSLHNLANALDEAGESELALETVTAGLAIRETALGPDHPEVALMHFDRGDILRSLGLRDQARVAFERALAIHRQAGNTRGPEVANIHLALGLLDASVEPLVPEQLEAASEHLRRARALQDGDTNLPPDDPVRAYLRQAEGVVHVRRGDFRSAHIAFAEATESLRRHDPSSSDVQAGTLKEIEMLYGLDAHDRVAQRVAREEPRIRAYLAALSAIERGRLGWYIADSCKRMGECPCATAYGGIAKQAYEELGDDGSVSELSTLIKDCPSSQPSNESAESG